MHNLTFYCMKTNQPILFILSCLSNMLHALFIQSKLKTIVLKILLLKNAFTYTSEIPFIYNSFGRGRRQSFTCAYRGWPSFDIHEAIRLPQLNEQRIYAVYVMLTFLHAATSWCKNHYITPPPSHIILTVGRQSYRKHQMSDVFATNTILKSLWWLTEDQIQDWEIQGRLFTTRKLD